MHFSIPESQEVKSTEGTYLVFRLHANGQFQAALRFKQFVALHQQLTKHHKGIPSLPPKKLLSLSPAQEEERRICLEKYIQQVNEIVGKSTLLYGFLRYAQLESSGETLTKKEIHVYLPNGERYSFNIWNNAPSSALLQMLTTQLKLKPKFISLFALLIFKREPNGVWNIVRKLEDYESPYISLSWLCSDHRIILRKWSWNQSLEDELLQDPVGLNLLYLQTVCDIEAGWIAVPKESLRTLCALESEGKKLEYLQIARALKFYGTVKFTNCEVTFPAPGTIVDIHVGCKELIFITTSRDIIIFKVTRIKCWRISLHQNPEGPYRAELSFEYLHSKNLLKWISIESAHSLLIALCLYEMVTEMEMVSKHSPSQIDSTETERSAKCPIYYFLRKDGEQMPITDAITASAALSEEKQHSMIGTTSSSPTLTSSSNGSRLSTSNSSYFSVKGNKNQHQFLENSVFADIGDDDL